MNRLGTDDVRRAAAKRNSNEAAGRNRIRKRWKPLGSNRRRLAVAAIQRDASCYRGVAWIHQDNLRAPSACLRKVRHEDGTSTRLRRSVDDGNTAHQEFPSLVNQPAKADDADRHVGRERKGASNSSRIKWRLT